MKFKERIQLNQGEAVSFVRKFKSRHYGRECRCFYNILDSHGKKVGKVIYKEENNVYGRYGTYYTLKQYDRNENLILKDVWE